MSTKGSVWRRFRRPMTVVPVLALVAGGFYLGTRANKRSSSSNATTTIERTVDVTSGPMTQSVAASGTLAPADVENLSFTVAGKVTSVAVTAGQHVGKGTTLATIDSAALQSQVTQAQAGVDSATARLATDTANSASAAQISADNANITAAQATLTDAKAALAGATLTAPIDGTVSAVNLTVGQQLGNAGTSGTSLSGSATGSGRSTGSTGNGSSGNGSSANGASTSGTSGSSGTGQVQVVSTGSYIVNLSVDDTQIGLLKAGQPAVVTRSNAAIGGGNRARGGFGQAATGAPGAPGQGGTGPASSSQNGAAGQNGGTGQGTARTAPAASATGVVTSVGTIATSTSGVASFPVVVTVNGTPTDFFAGATVEVSITYNQLPDVVQVPTAAVTQQSGQSFVTVVNGNQRTATAVRTGVVSGGQTQIVSGVDAGEQVLVSVRVPAAVATNANNNRTGTGVFTGGGFGGGAGGGGARTGRAGG